MAAAEQTAQQAQPIKVAVAVAIRKTLAAAAEPVGQASSLFVTQFN